MSVLDNIAREGLEEADASAAEDLFKIWTKDIEKVAKAILGKNADIKCILYFDPTFDFVQFETLDVADSGHPAQMFDMCVCNTEMLRAEWRKEGVDEGFVEAYFASVPMKNLKSLKKYFALHTRDTGLVKEMQASVTEFVSWCRKWRERNDGHLSINACYLFGDLKHVLESIADATPFGGTDEKLTPKVLQRNSVLFRMIPKVETKKKN